jgi:hypothetical protein
MDRHLLTYYIGIIIIVISHIYMLMRETSLTEKIHAYSNLIAVVMIAYYFMNKQGYIQF